MTFSNAVFLARINSSLPALLPMSNSKINYITLIATISYNIISTKIIDIFFTKNRFSCRK